MTSRNIVIAQYSTEVQYSMFILFFIFFCPHSYITCTVIMEALFVCCKHLSTDLKNDIKIKILKISNRNNRWH